MERREWRAGLLDRYHASSPGAGLLSVRGLGLVRCWRTWRGRFVQLQPKAFTDGPVASYDILA